MVFGVVPRLQAQVVGLPFISNNPRLKGLLEHPAGPFTIHFWAPTAKWLISAANIADVNRPVEKMSKPQQAGALCVPAPRARERETPSPDATPPPPQSRSRGMHGRDLVALLHPNHPR